MHVVRVLEPLLDPRCGSGQESNALGRVRHDRVLQIQAFQDGDHLVNAAVPILHLVIEEDATNTNGLHQAGLPLQDGRVLAIPLADDGAVV